MANQYDAGFKTISHRRLFWESFSAKLNKGKVKKATLRRNLEESGMKCATLLIREIKQMLTRETKRIKT